MKRGCLLFASALVVFVLFLAPFSSYSAQEDKEIHKFLLRLKPGIVLVYYNIQAQVVILMDDGKKVFPVDPIDGSGSGFIINPDGYLVTNGHVVAQYHESNEARLERQFFIQVIQKHLLPAIVPEGTPISDQDKLKYIVELYTKYRPQSQIIIKKNLHVILSNGEPYTAEIKAYSPPLTPQPGKISLPGAEQKMETGKDVAVLKIEGRNLPTVKLGDSGSVQLGEPLYVIGYPGVVTSHEWLSKKTILDSTVSSGHVSGAKLDVKGTPVIQTDAALTWGNSGGPAFNAKGEVIGVATFISISQATGVSQAIQGFNFLVPVNTVKEFVRTAGVDVTPESLFNKLWSEALDLYSQGKFKASLSKLDEVQRILPNQPDVRKLQVAAQEKVTSESTSQLPIIIVAVVILLAIAGGAAYWLLGRKKTKPSAVPAPTVIRDSGKPSSSGFLMGSEGALAGKTFSVGSSGIKIGRDPVKNQIVIDNDGISREHAWVGDEGGRMVVKDLNSLNGTFINSVESERIKTEPLKNGDIIIIGKGKFASFTFRT